MLLFDAVLPQQPRQRVQVRLSSPLARFQQELFEKCPHECSTLTGAMAEKQQA
jgi:hypothetical protein